MFNKTLLSWVIYKMNKKDASAMDNRIANKLTEEKQSRFHCGLYQKTQVNLTYNSNRIEGSRISEGQTRYIFETRTICFKDEEPVPVDDIIETTNHFVAFDYLLDTLPRPLSSQIIKEFHRILKSGTSDAFRPWLALGNWKKLPNEVGGAETTKPENVETDIEQLNEWYLNKENITFETIVEYHYRFGQIHPFQDGNGRVGRLIMFRECLKNNIVPFIIDETHKQFYYRGLKEFERVPDYLIDTCLSAQDTYNQWIKYFFQ